MTHAEIAFAVIVGVISAIGLVVSGVLTAHATRKAAELSAQEMGRQILLNSTAKLAEFRQRWINDLRDAMAKFTALAIANDASNFQETVEIGAKIALLMNRRDKRFPDLVRGMTAFRERAQSRESTFDLSAFRRLCQDILKDEWEVLKKELSSVPLAR